MGGLISKNNTDAKEIYNTNVEKIYNTDAEKIYNFTTKINVCLNCSDKIYDTRYIECFNCNIFLHNDCVKKYNDYRCNGCNMKYMLYILNYIKN